MKHLFVCLRLLSLIARPTMAGNRMKVVILGEGDNFILRDHLLDWRAYWRTDIISISPTVFPFPGRVGKTSILLRYVRGEYSDKQQSTLQASYLDKRLVAAGTPTHLSIWVRWWIVISRGTL